MVPEGIEGRVAFTVVSVSSILYQMAGGLKAGMGYVGGENINDFQKKTKFIKVSSKSFSESHIHDVSITKEAPNYRLE